MTTGSAAVSRGARSGGQAPLAAGWHIWEVRKGQQPQIGDDAWDELVSAADGYVTQTSGWVEYALATDYQRAVLIAGMDDEGKPRAVAVGFISEPRWPLRRFRTVRFLAYPSTGDDTAMRQLAVATCEATARAYGCIAMEFLSVGQPEEVTALKPPGYTVGELPEYVLDLRGGEQAVWTGLRRNHRRNIDLSARLGVRVVRATSLESVRTLRELQVEVAMRHAAQGDSFRLRPTEIYDSIQRVLIPRGLARLYCAYVEGTAVSALLCTTFGRRARTFYAGSSERGYEARSSFAVNWHAIAELSQEGFAELSFGVGEDTPKGAAQGLHDFKVGFGARTRRTGAATKHLWPGAVRVYHALELARSSLRATAGEGNG